MALESDVKSVEFLLNHGANTELKVQKYVLGRYTYCNIFCYSLISAFDGIEKIRKMIEIEYIIVD